MASNGRSMGEWSAASRRAPIDLRQGPTGINLSALDPTPQELDKSREKPPRMNPKRRSHKDIKRINALWDRTGVLPR